jgi:hypothetical protein
MTDFTKIFRSAGSSMSIRASRANKWFKDSIKNIFNYDPEGVYSKTAMPQIGRMYMFAYDPKHASTLPYYDRFPLVFPFKKLNDGFLGINLHYLPLILRAKLMDALYDLVNNTSYDETTRLRLTYDILDRTSKFRYFKPCVKHYLNNMIDSRIIFIHPDEWEIALFLPLHRFRNATAAQVHKDSRNKITRR